MRDAPQHDAAQQHAEAPLRLLRLLRRRLLRGRLRRAAPLHLVQLRLQLLPLRLQLRNYRSLLRLHMSIRLIS